MTAGALSHDRHGRGSCSQVQRATGEAMIAGRSCDWATYDSKASERAISEGIVPVEHREAMINMEIQKIDLLGKDGAKR